MHVFLSVREIPISVVTMADQNRASSSTSDLEEHLLGYEKEDHDDFEPLSKKRPSSRREWWKWGLHLIMFIFNASLALYLVRHSRATVPAKPCSVLRDHELPWAADVVSYEEKVFVASGFHERDDAPPTEFEGFGDPAIDRAWANLTTGMFRLLIFDYC